MNWILTLMVVLILGASFLLIVGVLIKHPWFVQDYPKHLENLEELEDLDEQ
jgi:hypothetical protein